MADGRGEMSECYLNSRWGVEQGITVKTAPAGKNRKNLVVELSLTGDVQPGLNGNTLVLADEKANSKYKACTGQHKYWQRAGLTLYRKYGFEVVEEKREPYFEQHLGSPGTVRLKRALL